MAEDSLGELANGVLLRPGCDAECSGLMPSGCHICSGDLMATGVVVPALLIANAVWFFICAVWGIRWGLTLTRSVSEGHPEVLHRFGAVNEIGVFAMTDKGLRGVSNPSAIFLSQHAEPVPGSCVLVTLEGTRPLLVEVQALVDTGGPSPRRLSVGLERDRLAMLLAVLHRHAGVACMDQDVFVNAVGGVRISEPAADLAVLLAIQSSLRGKPLPKGFIAFGEIGLAGEVRPAPRGQERLKEAAKLGFDVALIPKANAPKKAIEGMRLLPVERVDEAIAALRELD